MGVYGGIQLPKISENTLDDRKERKQILNYLALLDEKLRYMFQNIDIEENLSADSQKMFFRYGEDIKNLIKDTEGNFSLFEQTINGISSAVQDVEGNVSLLRQTAESLSSSIASAEGKISGLEQTAESIESSVYDLDDELGELSSDYKQTAKQMSWIVKSGTSASSMVLTDDFLRIITNSVEIRADVELYGYMTVWRDDGYDVVGGYIGYGVGDDGVNASTSGIMMASDGLNSDDEPISYFIATNSGVRMTYQNPDDESEFHGIYVTDSGPEMVYDDGTEQHKVYCASTGPYMIYDDGDVKIGVRARSSGVRLTAESFDINFDHEYGNLAPSDDGAQLLGTDTKRWQGLYAKNGTIQTSDRRKKEDITYDMERYEEFFGKLSPAFYKMTEGESGRYHVGFVSQDVEEALESSGLTNMDFAGFVKSPIYAEYLDTGNPDKNSAIIDHNYSLRYDEFVALNTHMIQKLMARVAELESKLEALS